MTEQAASSPTSYLFTVVKGNPTATEEAAIDKALRQMCAAANTDSYPHPAPVMDNWGAIATRNEPIRAYAPTAYLNQANNF